MLPNLLLSPALLRALLEQPIAQSRVTCPSLTRVSVAGVEATLTANLATEVFPTTRSCLPRSSRRTRSKVLGVRTWRGEPEKHRLDKAREGRVPDSWRTSRQERAGTTKTKEPDGQEAEGAGKGNGGELGR